MIRGKRIKVIAFFSTTRADFGELAPLIKKVNKEKRLDSMFFVGGTHLAFEYGKTINDITSCGININETFDYLIKNMQR